MADRHMEAMPFDAAGPEPESMQVADSTTVLSESDEKNVALVRDIAELVTESKQRASACEGAQRP